MSAVESMDWKKLKKAGFGKKLSFATHEKVKELTGCLTGAVPPFGSVFNA